MIRADGDQLFDTFAHLLRRAVNAASVCLCRVVVNLGEPTVHLGTRALRTFVYVYEHSFRDRIGGRIAPLLLECGPQQRHALPEAGHALPSRANPAIPNRCRATKRLRMASAHPDRGVRLLDRL